MVIFVVKKKGRKIIASNRKARYEYFIEDTLEAGLVLKGTEVKSIRQGKINIQEGYAIIENGQAYIYSVHISPYEHGNIQNVDSIRKRKLLLHKREINKLEALIMQKGYTLIPLSIYLRNGLVKVELAVGKGKKLYDKRDVIAKKDANRRIEREFKERYY